MEKCEFLRKFKIEISEIIAVKSALKYPKLFDIKQTSCFLFSGFFDHFDTLTWGGPQVLGKVAHIHVNLTVKGGVQFYTYYLFDDSL